MGENLNLPPGFKFHPTDEELITFYLVEKFRNQNFNPIAIGEANLNSCEPWDLSSQAKMKEKELYFFFKRDKKYPTGTRTNRATASGYWKATGKDKEIFHGGKPPSLMGMKKTLVFYQGRAPRGKKTNWVMHEYRLEGKSPGYDAVKHSKDEWVVCRVFEKGTSPKTKSSDLERIDSFGDFFDDRFSYDGDCGIGKATPAATVNPSYPGHVWSGFPSQEFIFYSQGAAGAVGHLPSSSANASFMHPHGNFGYPSEPTASAFRSQPKTEQHSNHSFVSASQDTGLSTDRYTEISSVISKSDGDYHSSSANPADDFVGLWEC